MLLNPRDDGHWEKAFECVGGKTWIKRQELFVTGENVGRDGADGVCFQRALCEQIVEACQWGELRTVDQHSCQRVGICEEVPRKRRDVVFMQLLEEGRKNEPSTS